ncbi:MAG: hypothetical protein A2284_14315 [Deltaproteobacteria bacterium RIFOXYA12_FULL_61_11]|nr:MAG: hypothetical protein A2284_14315 [Deltaproteobacteria bacterium RIFOXYA12_FULL_61_11]
MIDLSLCMIVRDERGLLPAALRSVAGLVREMVVVDTGSRDGTPEVAAAHGARVVAFPWNDDFSAARNVSLELATSAWILVLDADEVLAPRDHAALSALLSGEPALYQLVQTTYTTASGVFGYLPNQLGVPEAEGYPGYFESSLVRLFPREARFRFQGLIHEHCVDLRGELQPVPTGLRLHHYGKVALDERQRRRKMELYLALSERKAEVVGGSTPWYELGMQLWEVGRFGEAEQAFTRSLETAKRPGRILCAKGSLLLHVRRTEEALELFRRAEHAEPEEPLPLLLQSSALLELGRTAECVPLLRRLAARTPKDFQVFNNLGVLQLATNEPERAMVSLEKALKLGGAQEHVLLNLGLAAIDLGRFAELEDLRQRMLQSHPRSLRLYELWGGRLLSRGRTELLGRVFPDLPDCDDPMVRCLRGLQRLREGKQVEARAEFQKALASNPEHPLAASLLAAAGGTST